MKKTYKFVARHGAEEFKGVIELREGNDEPIQNGWFVASNITDLECPTGHLLIEGMGFPYGGRLVSDGGNGVEYYFGMLKTLLGNDWEFYLSDTLPNPEENPFIINGYETRKIYTGQGDYHSHHSEYMNLPKKMKAGSYRIGIELEVVAKTISGKEEINRIKSNWFYQERDGSLPNRGIELITIPLLPKDAKSTEFWDPFVSFIAKRANSWGESSCGLHVHIGREILGDTPEKQSESLGKLLFLYHHFLNENPVNKRIFGRESGYHARDGKTEYGNAVKTIGSSILKDKEIRDKLSKSMTDLSASQRYFDINLQNAKTIEFRKGRGSINSDRIVSVVSYCEMMILYAKATPWDKISYDGFEAYLKKNLAKTSPLRRFFPSGEYDE